MELTRLEALLQRSWNGILFPGLVINARCWFSGNLALSQARLDLWDVFSRGYLFWHMLPPSLAYRYCSSLNKKGPLSALVLTACSSVGSVVCSRYGGSAFPEGVVAEGGLWAVCITCLSSLFLLHDCGRRRDLSASCSCSHACHMLPRFPSLMVSYTFSLFYNLLLVRKLSQSNRKITNAEPVCVLGLH